MIVSCPSCAARFRVADELIGADGRLVRCGRCAYSWHQIPVPEGPVPLELSEALPEAAPIAPPLPRETMARDAAPLRPERRRGEEKAYFEKQRKRGGGLGGWLLFLLVLAAIAGAGWYWRNDIVAAVPESARVYEYLGIEVAQPTTAGTPAGRLEVVNYTFMRRLVDNERRLVVSGEIVNRSAEALKVPTLRARVLDESGNEIMTWDFTAPDAQLQPGASTRFESQHEHPDYAGQINVEVQLLPVQ